MGCTAASVRASGGFPGKRLPSAKRCAKKGTTRGYFDIPRLEKVFSAFWEGLNLLADVPCPGCRAGAGLPDCAVRACARGRSVTACPFCADFPCERLTILNHYPLLLADGRRMREIDLEQWVAEHEARDATGFACADVRFPEKV